MTQAQEEIKRGMTRSRRGVRAGIIIAAVGLLVVIWASQRIPGTPFDPFPALGAVQNRVAAGNEQFRFAVMGDTKNEQPQLRDALALAQRDGCDFSIHVGDIVQRGGGWTAASWRRLSSICGDLMRKTPLLPVVGNHELTGLHIAGQMRFLQFFGLSQDHYTFDVGRYRFIVLSWQQTEQIGTGKGGDSPSLRWLMDQLAQAKGKYPIVCCHEPIYTVGSRAKDREGLARLFRDSGVRLVLNGHDHVYYRTVRDGCTYVVAGAGARKLMYPLLATSLALPGDAYVGIDAKSGVPVLAHVGTGPSRQLPDLSFCLVEFQVDGDRMQLRAVDSKGVVLDTFEIPSSDSRPAPEQRGVQAGQP